MRKDYKMNIIELAQLVKCHVLDTTPRNIVGTKRMIATDENGTAFLDVQDTSREGLIYFDCIFRDGQVTMSEVKRSTARKAINAQISESTYDKLNLMAVDQKRSMASMIEWLVEEKHRQTYGG
jgi:hypothetical protein